VPNATLCTDGQLARIGFMDPKDVEGFVGHLPSRGLQFLSQGKCVDIAVVDQQRGSTMSCDWLELARAPFGKEGGRVAICWLFDGPRVAAGLHLPESSLDLAIPEGWTYEGPLASVFSLCPPKTCKAASNTFAPRGASTCFLIRRQVERFTSRTIRTCI
jgi:hypothetical protein